MRRAAARDRLAQLAAEHGTTIRSLVEDLAQGTPTQAEYAERPGLLGYFKGLRYIRVEAFDTNAVVTATELLRFGHSFTAVHAIHAARPSPAYPGGRFLLTLTPKAYAGTGVQAVHPGQ